MLVTLILNRVIVECKHCNFATTKKVIFILMLYFSNRVVIEGCRLKIPDWFHHHVFAFIMQY